MKKAEEKNDFVQVCSLVEKESHLTRTFNRNLNLPIKHTHTQNDGKRVSEREDRERIEHYLREDCSSMLMSNIGTCSNYANWPYRAVKDLHRRLYESISVEGNCI